MYTGIILSTSNTMCVLFPLFSCAPGKIFSDSVLFQDNQGYVKSVKMMDNGIMEQGNHRSFVLRAENQAERDAWVEALRSEVPAFQMTLSSNPSNSVTPSTSSQATPIGTPSDNGRRASNKFVAGLSERKRRGTVEMPMAGKMPAPVIRGWARTQNDQYQVFGCMILVCCAYPHLRCSWCCVLQSCDRLNHLAEGCLLYSMCKFPLAVFSVCTAQVR